MKEVNCPAGEWTTLTRSIAAGMPASWTVQLEGSDLTGSYRVYRSFLPFGIGFGEPETGQLQATMGFSRGWFDASFKVEIQPQADLTARL